MSDKNNNIPSDPSDLVSTLSTKELDMVQKGKEHWRKLIENTGDGRISSETLGYIMDLIVENVWSESEKFYNNKTDKYVLCWSDGDGYTYHSEQSQPFKTDDIDKWECELISEIEKSEGNITFKGIHLPVNSPEFSYEIKTLDGWFNGNL